MRIVQVFIILATITLVAYVFALLNQTALYIAMQSPDLQNSYRTVHDSINYGAVTAALFTAMGISAIAAVYLFIRWLGEIISG